MDDERGSGPIGSRILEIEPGDAITPGVSRRNGGLNFTLASADSTFAALTLFDLQDETSFIELVLDPARNRTGHVWHVALHGLPDDLEYVWRLDRQASDVTGRAGHLAQDDAAARDDVRFRFDSSVLLLDPWAREIRRLEGRHGTNSRRAVRRSTERRSPRPERPRLPMKERVLYEMHAGGFTRHASSGVRHRGTFRGIIEKIPYLKDLGVTTIELLPVYEFDESKLNDGVDPSAASRLRNYWGYQPISFFAPAEEYGGDARPIHAFRELVDELHRNGLEIFLDVVFNHTAEGKGGPGDPTYGYRGIDNPLYYMLDPATGGYLDFTGCGNTLNCNHPHVRDLICDALRYWAAEMDVDGFRFDLASVLSRGRDGSVLVNPPLIERIGDDPVLADVTLVAEAWDAAGLYQVGNFPLWGRWAEWNGPFRDDVRRFVRGDGGLAGRLASRLSGSSDLYARAGGRPSSSINFITAHDGFTLRDLVSYDRKHNEANGEGNRDGSDENFSWNCGVEGATDDPAVLRLRDRLTRNHLTLLFLSQGAPMLLAGDEMGRSQRGNNNAYCQDNDISWIDWSLLDSNAGLFRFVKLLIAFRRSHSVLRRDEFLTGRSDGRRDVADVTWHGVSLGRPDFGGDSRSLAMHLAGDYAPQPDCDIYLAVNSWVEDLNFDLPRPPAGSRWVRVVDTSQSPPNDILEEGREPVVVADRLVVTARSCVVLRSCRL